MKDFLLARLKEKSTWATIITLIGAAIGIEISPESKEQISLGALAVVSLIAAFVGEDKKPE